MAGKRRHRRPGRRRSQVPAGRRGRRDAARDHRRGARAHRRRTARVRHRHRYRGRQRAQPGSRLLRFAGRRATATTRSSRRWANTACGCSRRSPSRSAPRRRRSSTSGPTSRSARPSASTTSCARTVDAGPRRDGEARPMARRSRRRPMASAWSTSRPVSPATTSSAMLRQRFGERQVGHAGTLDPDATGVLVVGVGMTTNCCGSSRRPRKRYVGEVVLGTETSTLDSAGEVTATYDMSAVTLDDARASRHRAPDRRDRADPTDGVGDQGRWPAPARARPRGRRDRACAAAGDRVLRSTSPPARTRCVCRSTSRARPARTSARWPPISVACSAVARTSATCAAPPSATFTLDEAAGPDDCAAAAGRHRGARARHGSTSTTPPPARGQRPGAAARAGRRRPVGRVRSRRRCCSPCTSRSATDRGRSPSSCSRRRAGG